MFNRELTIKTRSNNNSSNVQPRVEIPMLQQQQPFPMRNPFETISRFGNDHSRVQQPTNQFNQSSSLRAGFNPIPTKASMQMQPQPLLRSNNPSQPPNALNLDDLNKLIAMGSNMLQSNSRQLDMQTRPSYDMLFADKDVSARHSSNLKMSSRHNSRAHYRDEPYSRRDLPRHQHRNSGDRRRR